MEHDGQKNNFRWLEWEKLKGDRQMEAFDVFWKNYLTVKIFWSLNVEKNVSEI